MNKVLGRYSPLNTFMHRLDARNKIVCLILIMVACFWQFNLPDGSSDFKMLFLVEGTLLFIAIILMIVSKISFTSLFSSLKPLWFVALFLFVINCLLPPFNAYVYGEAFHIWRLTIYWGSIFQSIWIILRIALMLMFTLILTATTKPLDLTFAIEWFMTPLKLVRFPVHEIAMTLSIALRFIPTLLDETDRIMKAQASRGVDFKHGRISSRIRALVSLIVPLFISAFQRSEELADAMEARGYNPRAKRTKYRKLTISVYDPIVLLFTTALLTGVILLGAFHIDMSMFMFIPWYILAIYGMILLFILLGIIWTTFSKEKKVK